MATFIGSTQAQSGTIAAPAATLTGDLLIAHVYQNSDATGQRIPLAAGWTEEVYTRRYQGSTYNIFQVWSKVATADGAAAGSINLDTASGDSPAAAIVAYRGATGVDASSWSYSNSSNTTVPCPSVTTTGSNEQILRFLATPYSTTPPAPPSGTTARYSYQASAAAITMADSTQAAAGDTGTATFGYSSLPIVATVALQGNTAPNAPTLTSLVDGSPIDINATNRAAHQFSDPDPGDSQSALDHRYRAIGAASWTQAYLVTPNQWVDYPAGTFANGVDYERQVRTYDAQGVVGPWSSSGFFTGATRPPAPTITDPLNGATFNQNETVTWSAPNQDAYQVQVLDEASAVVYDTGEVGGQDGSTTRSISVAFPDNNTTRTVRTRVKDAGLWSDWYAITGNVSWTPPSTPVVTLTPDLSGGSLLVGISNPTPGAGEPTVAYNEVWVDDGNGLERRATDLATNAAWTYWTPVSGRDYAAALRVVAVASNGTTASS